MMSKTKRGRRISGDGERVFALWRKLGEPSAYRSGLAKAWFGKQYEEASGTTRRQMRDRLREHLLRQFDREIERLEAESARLEAEIARLKAEIARLKAEIAARRAHSANIQAPRARLQRAPAGLIALAQIHEAGSVIDCSKGQLLRCIGNKMWDEKLSSI